MTVIATSHIKPEYAALIDSNSPNLAIISPPRSGMRFAKENLLTSLAHTADDPNSNIRIMATSYLSELSQDQNTICIVRKPIDWIVSLVTTRLYLEGKTNISSLLDEEILAAEFALKQYIDFTSDKVIFIKFEDLVFKFFKTVRKIAEVFTLETVEQHGLRFGIVKLPKDIPASPTTATRLSNYRDVVTELSNKDLSKVNALYQELVAKTTTIV